MYQILVVDDELAVRLMIREMLEPLGYDVIEAESSMHALDKCKERPVDLVITDIVMPEKNGIDLIMEFKKAFPDMPVVAISGGGGITGRYNYLEIAKLVGAKNILKKPFAALDLREAVTEALAQRPGSGD